MTGAIRQIGAPVIAADLFPRPGLYPPDSRATLRRRAADRAIIRRFGALKAIVASVRSDSAAYRGGLALFDHPAAEVATALGEWHRRNTSRTKADEWGDAGALYLASRPACTEPEPF